MAEMRAISEMFFSLTPTISQSSATALSFRFLGSYAAPPKRMGFCSVSYKINMTGIRRVSVGGEDSTGMAA
jgi:hypothetical protein